MQRRNHLPYAYSRRLRRNNKGWHHNASLIDVCVHASMCVFVLQARSAGQDKYAFKRLIFHFRNRRRQNGSNAWLVGEHNARHGVVETKQKREIKCLLGCRLRTHKGKKPGTCILCTNTIEHKAQHLKNKSCHINPCFVWWTSENQCDESHKIRVKNEQD